METIPSVIIITSAAIAAIFIMSNMIPATQTDTSVQKKSDPANGQTAAIQGYCADPACVMEVIRECKESETKIMDASNATKIVTIGGDGVYQGQAVCKISIHEENSPSTTNMTSFQSWSCKVPVAELNNSTGGRNFDELVRLLVASEHCGPQI